MQNYYKKYFSVDCVSMCDCEYASVYLYLAVVVEAWPLQNINFFFQLDTHPFPSEYSIAVALNHGETKEVWPTILDIKKFGGPLGKILFIFSFFLT